MEEDTVVITKQASQTEKIDMNPPPRDAAISQLTTLLARLIARHHLRLTTEAARDAPQDEASNAVES